MENPGDAGVTPAGYQGAAQHTYTPACDGFHEPGQCPRSEQPQEIVFSGNVTLPARAWGAANSDG